MSNELETLMVKVDWESASDRERVDFANLFTLLEFAKINRMRFDSARHSRMTSLLANSTLVAVLLFFQVDVGTVLIASMALQIAMFSLSQLFDYFAKKAVLTAEGITIDSIKTLARKYPYEK